MNQFGVNHYWTKEQAECLEQWRERSENANRLMSPLVIFPAARGVGVELPEGGVISTAAVRSLVSLPEQRRKV